MRRRRPHRPPEPRDVPRREPRAAVAVALLERRRELELHERPPPEPLHDRRLEAGVGEHAARPVLELRERPQAVRRDELLRRSEAVDALLRIDDEDAAELVDAVDRADVDAREVFDVDAGLGDDVRHARECSRGLGPGYDGSVAPDPMSSATRSGARSTSADLTMTWSNPAACARCNPDLSVWFV